MRVEVTDDTGQHRYEGRINGELAAIAEYIRTAQLVVFTHTEVLPGHEGQGVASELVRQALDDVRSQGLAVLPLCPFVGAWIGRHRAEYGDLVYHSRTTVTPEADAAAR
ncbi:GNAT family N-acetyltransferase [Blastococcus sp. SYSU DS0552]